MKPTKTLPPQYQHKDTLDLSNNRRLTLVLNVSGLLLFLLSAVFFIQVALFLRQDEEMSFAFDSGFSVLLALLAGVLVLLLTLVVPEAVHGLVFWLLTKAKPTFGVKGFYAYAAVPEWYLPRSAFFVAALAPLVLVTAVGLLLMPVISQTMLPFLLLWLVFNTTGSVGDMAAVIWLWRQPRATYVNDFGDGITIYHRGGS
ncbi:MAG: DUF3267 domain-containing protein [Anaerolineaceae bacterium]|nr:DUF3267 domain-containing protein [Anaerolineaceae bacterium]